MQARPPSLRAIVAFEAAARHLSFSKAAEELNLTQSAISHSVRGLEERLGIRLFLRAGRAVMLTNDGRRLAERMGASLMLLSQTMEDLEVEESEVRLAIASPPDFAASVLLRHWQLFQKQRPSLRLRLQLYRPGEEETQKEADLTIVQGAGAWAGKASRPIRRETLVPVAAASMPVDGGLTRLPLIENTRHPWSLWFSYTQSLAPSAEPALIVDDWDVAMEAARRGFGVCLARESLLAEDLRKGEVVRVGSKRMPGPGGYSALWRPSAPSAHLVEAFIERLCRRDADEGEADADDNPVGLEWKGAAA
jgi:LysR family glycine cleavage system transcriptional activator